MAARSGQAEVVRYLVQDGAQVEAKAKVCAVRALFATKRRNDFNKTFKHLIFFLHKIYKLKYWAG